MERISTTRLIIETIPQVFESEEGPVPVRMPIDGEDISLHSIVSLSPELESYLKTCQEIWDDVKPLTEGKITQLLEREWIQQKFAVAWLEARTEIRCWDQIIDYMRRLTRRTLENESASKTLLVEVTEAPESAPQLDDSNLSKVLDWLGSSQLTYFKVDQNLKIKALEAISLSDVAERGTYRFYPDFLGPIIDQIKGTSSVVVHVNAQGDLLIASEAGILATNRKDRWTIFDIDHLIQSVAKILDENIGKELKNNDPTCVACSLFQILFDVSFKRHGGLILIDTAEDISRYVVKGIERTPDSPLNSIFTHWSFDGLEYSIPEVSKLVELSSVDGALVLDPRGNLVQVGSMIVSHPDAQNSFGARDTAAYSAAKYGATAFKISQDGQVSILFTLKAFQDGDHVYRLDLI